MGVLFMVSSYTLREAPLGPFKAEEVCMSVHTLSPPGSSTHLGEVLVPKYPHSPAHKGLECIWLDLCHFYSLKLLIIPEVWWSCCMLFCFLVACTRSIVLRG